MVSSGYITSRVDPVHMNEGLGGIFDTIIAAASTINPLTDLILYFVNKLWPPVEIHGDLHFHDEKISFGVQINLGDQQAGYCMVDGQADQPGVIPHLVNTLAYKVILLVSRG
jgi:hypothetical protein